MHDRHSGPRAGIQGWHLGFNPMFMPTRTALPSPPVVLAKAGTHILVPSVFAVILAPTEGASKRTPYYLKDDWVSFNAWSATYALTHILEGRFGTDKYHLVIMDRGLFDALAWFELLNQDQKITPSDCSAIQKFLLIGHWRELVDMIFLFQTDPETSLQRENSYKLLDEPGTAMNPKVLEKLNGAYDEIQRNFADKFSSVYTIDTGKDSLSNQQGTAFEVAKAILYRLSPKSE